MESQGAIVLFRRDLRLDDNAALAEACARGGPVVPCFAWAPEEDGAWAPGAASRWWLHHSLGALDASLRERGARLVVRRGPTREALEGLVEETGARAVYWNRSCEPARAAADADLADALRARGIEARSFAGALLAEPASMRKKDDSPYRVFTPFFRTFLARVRSGMPLRPPREIPFPADAPDSLPREALELLPRVAWAAGLRATWTPGEAGAAAAWKRFLARAASRYEEARDVPGIAGTSRLSPHLHFGEISVRRMWRDAARRRKGMPAAKAAGIDAYVRQLVWREFAHHVLWHFPRTPDDPLQIAFARFPWVHAPEALGAWRRGRTGYPIVDAGMRELWATGWMHNRVRMIVASFLVKHLRISWQEGARWFWDTLVDGDLANNTFGWQWAAGCGADAAPYFRIFNPELQGRKFDPEGVYVRRWVPELAALPARWIHAPWRAPADVLRASGVELGRSYPAPIVEHAAARAGALAALASMRKGARHTGSGGGGSNGTQNALERRLAEMRPDS